MREFSTLFLTGDAELFNICRTPFADSGGDITLMRSLKEALRLAGEHPSSVLLADCDGNQEIAKLGGGEAFFRKARELTPKLVLVGIVEQGAPTQKILGLLKAGANDVVQKPLRPRVLAEQVKALARLYSKTAKKQSRLSSKTLQLNLDVASRRCYFKVDDGAGSQRVELRLTRLEFAVLHLLLERKHKLVTYDEFRKRLWPHAASGGDITHTLLMHLTNIRKKLKGSSVQIDNLWGEGFRLD